MGSKLSWACLAFFCLRIAVWAEEPPPAQPTPTAPKTVAAKPLTFDWGFEQRTRTEDWDNITDYNNATNDTRHQVRFRNRAWLKAPVGSSVDFFLGMDNEFKKQTYPDVQLNGDEVFFEALYVDFKKLPVHGLSLRVGRQNLMHGEGFILMDGSSGDGSRSLYFNGVDLSYKFRKSNFEVIGILDPRQDRFLPVIHDQHKYLNEWDEQAVGFYYTDKNLKKTDVESYYFYKKEVHDYRAPSNPQFQPDRHISTLGTRVTEHLRSDLTATGEFAGQWGRQHPDTDIRAWAGYGCLKKTFAKKSKPYVLGGFWALSGDNPGTHNTIEGWDPVFSRWPKWSELYLYSLVREKGVGYWTNDRFSQLEAGFTPWKPLSVRGTWYHHNSFQPFAGTPAMFAAGTGRGDNFQVRGDVTLNANLKGHILYEALKAGDFYQHQPTGYFFRAEVSYTFNGSVPLRGTK